MSGREAPRIFADSFILGDRDRALPPGPFKLIPNLTSIPDSTEEAWSPELPASVSYIVGVVIIIIVVLGLIENGTVLFVYSRTKKLRQADMSFVIGLSLSDLGQTALNLPFVAVACFSKRWVFGTYGCMYIGFVTMWFGLSQISLLCVIALERYFIIVQQCRRLSASTARTVGTIAGCFVYGGCWAVGPLVGWSEYKLVAGEISCSLSWTLKNDLYLSYVLALFSFVWFLPLGIITFSYIRIAQMVYREKQKRQNLCVTRKENKEKKVAVTGLLMIGAFVISWTPYSVIALLTTFGDMSKASSAVYLIPAVFAKASIIWNPIIYIARHKEFRRACGRMRLHMLSWLSQYTTLCWNVTDTFDDSSYRESVFSGISLSVICGTNRSRPTQDDTASQKSLYILQERNSNGNENSECDDRFQASQESQRNAGNENNLASARHISSSQRIVYSCEDVNEFSLLKHHCGKTRRYNMAKCNLTENNIHVPCTNVNTTRRCSL